VKLIRDGDEIAQLAEVDVSHGLLSSLILRGMTGVPTGPPVSVQPRSVSQHRHDLLAVQFLLVVVEVTPFLAAQG
jgi:hypothetical protein